MLTGTRHSPRPLFSGADVFGIARARFAVAGSAGAWLFEILDRMQANLFTRVRGESSSPRRNVMLASSPVEQLPQHVLHRLTLLLCLRRGVAWLGMRLRGWILAWRRRWSSAASLIPVLARPLAQSLLQKFAERFTKPAAEHIRQSGSA